jgi:hypothetical protein
MINLNKPVYILSKLLTFTAHKATATSEPRSQKLTSRFSLKGYNFCFFNRLSYFQTMDWMYGQYFGWFEGEVGRDFGQGKYAGTSAIKP